MGKLLAAMAPPLLASYLGISVYLVGVYIDIAWRPPIELLMQILLLTTVQAVLMVSGAVVISSQTTSVRAANLLASFIIIPMALLIQGESILMFWGLYRALWWAVIGQLIIAVLLVRTGVAYFNREEMLGRELDVLNFRWAWREFVHNFAGTERTPWGWYRRKVFPAIWALRLPIAVTAAALVIAILGGLQAARQMSLPPELVNFDTLGQGFVKGLETIKFLSPAGVLTIWLHNIRAMAIALFLGIFSFGVLGLVVLFLPIAFIAYIAGKRSPGQRFADSVFTGAGTASRCGRNSSHHPGRSSHLKSWRRTDCFDLRKNIGGCFIHALARSAIVMVGVVFPLFLFAAILEVYLTPSVAVWLLVG